MDTLVFHRKRKLHTNTQYPVGVYEDAFQAICEIAEKTDRSRTEIATTMILYAKEHVVIED